MNFADELTTTGAEMENNSICQAIDSSSTIKKGILWQQQSFDKFHQRIFNRWKKRYFILTTDYLVCFKRSSPKVGRSEMGKFLYKVSEQKREYSYKCQVCVHAVPY